jgi:hypothetical protein
MRALVPFVMLACCLGLSAAADEPAKEFSGPQVGEKAVPFSAKGILGASAGKEFNLVNESAGRPLVIFFLQEVNRPSVGLARLVLNYAASRKADGLSAGLVLVTADATATEEWIKRAAGALPSGVPIGISADGAEGPGAYGLNRKVQVTVLVVKEDKVTANFALVQPSIEADAPKIAAAVVAAVGSGTPPTVEEMQKLVPAPARRPK